MAQGGFRLASLTLGPLPLVLRRLWSLIMSRKSPQGPFIRLTGKAAGGAHRVGTFGRRAGSNAPIDLAPSMDTFRRAIGRRGRSPDEEREMPYSTAGVPDPMSDSPAPSGGKVGVPRRLIGWLDRLRCGVIGDSGLCNQQDRLTHSAPIACPRPGDR